MKNVPTYLSQKIGDTKKKYRNREKKQREKKCLSTEDDGNGNGIEMELSPNSSIVHEVVNS